MWHNQKEYICEKVCHWKVDEDGKFKECTENKDWDPSFGNGIWDPAEYRFEDIINGENQMMLNFNKLLLLQYYIFKYLML